MEQQIENSDNNCENNNENVPEFKTSVLDSKPLDDILEEDEEIGRGIATPKSNQDGEHKNEFTVPGTKKGSVVIKPLDLPKKPKKYNKNSSSRPWDLFDSMENVKNTQKHTSRTSINGTISFPGTFDSDEMLDSKISEVSNEIEKLSHIEKGNSLPNYITARKYLYQIETKNKKLNISNAEGIKKNKEIHEKAQQFLNKYKAKIFQTHSNSTASNSINSESFSQNKKSIDNYAEYLKSKYLSNSDSTKSVNEIMQNAQISATQKSSQYGLLMAQFKNPEKFTNNKSLSPNIKKTLSSEKIDILKTEPNLPKTIIRPMISLANTGKIIPSANIIMNNGPLNKILKTPTDKKIKNSSKKETISSLENNKNTDNEAHNIEVMVLCDKIHKIEDELKEKNQVIEKLKLEIETLKAENEELKKLK